MKAGLILLASLAVWVERNRFRTNDLKAAAREFGYPPYAAQMAP
jgi:hypothetical protein